MKQFQAHVEHIFGHSCSHAIASIHAQVIKEKIEAIAQYLEQQGHPKAAQLIREKKHE